MSAPGTPGDGWSTLAKAVAIAAIVLFATMAVVSHRLGKSPAT
jgi:hypothetical protein